MARRLPAAITGALMLAAGACSDATGPAPGASCATRPATAMVQFEDADLDLAIRGALGASTLLPLTCGLVEGLTSLNAASRGITSLEGIENLTALTTLNIRDNAITDLTPLGRLTGLSSLNLAANRIGDIEPLRGLTALTFLAVNDNGAIRDLGPLSELTSLSGTLWLGGNAIEDLEPLRALTRLSRLRAWDNAITDLAPLADLTGLVEINVHTNAITDTNGLAALTDLMSLNLRANAGLVDIQELIDNPGLGAGADVNLAATGVSCADVDALAAKGVSVISDCR